MWQRESVWRMTRYQDLLPVSKNNDRDPLTSQQIANLIIGCAVQNNIIISTWLYIHTCRDCRLQSILVHTHTTSQVVPKFSMHTHTHIHTHTHTHTHYIHTCKERFTGPRAAFVSLSPEDFVAPRGPSADFGERANKASRKHTHTLSLSMLYLVWNDADRSLKLVHAAGCPIEFWHLVSKFLFSPLEMHYCSRGIRIALILTSRMINSLLNKLGCKTYIYFLLVVK